MSYQALRGITVLDLGIITAGASTSTILADLGAEVIKIEGPRYIDPFRYWSDNANDGRWWDESAPFNLTNRGKRSVCIDLKSDDGRAVFLDLVRRADVVVENFRVGVLDALGIPYETLRRTNEAIVLISISSQGQTGPDAKAVSFGSTLEGSSGMASLIRYPDGAPQISGHALNYPDQVVSLFAAGAVMCALAQRKSGRSGCHIDLSQRELASFMLGDYLMAAIDGVPSTVPPTLGVQVVAATSDERWIAVHFDSAELAARFAGSGEEGLERQIEDSVRKLPAQAAIGQIAAAGGQGVLVRNASDLLDEGSPGRRSHALVRDANGHSVKGLPWRSGVDPLPPPSMTVPLGFDNEDIIVGRLGRTPGELRRLLEHGVIATGPRD